MMPFIIHSAIILAVCYIFYKILLQKETFYKLNRYILLACLLLSFLLPLIPVPQEWSFRKLNPATNITETPFYTTHKVNTQSLPLSTSGAEQEGPILFTSFEAAMKWIVLLYWIGVVVFSINLLFQLIILFHRIYTAPFIKDGKFRIVEVSGDKAPCSFGNNIFINPEKYDWETYNRILEHEKIHISEKHSYDILLAEIVLIFQWFNPFAWQYRKELENNLEFFTDYCLLQYSGIEKSSYQMSLLKVSAPHLPLKLTTNYNQSLLKKRLVMMNAKKSDIHTSWKYLFLLPVLMALVSFLNKPVALEQIETDTTKEKKFNATEGLWFAEIRTGGIQINFKSDIGNNINGTIFSTKELKDLTGNKKGTFSIKREAGTMEFTGKFEGSTGRGRYRFIADKAFTANMQKEGIELWDDHTQMTFFFVNVKHAYVQMLKQKGYENIKKNDLLPLAALDVSADFIESIEKTGFNNISLQDLVAFKSLGVTNDYINELKNASYPKVSANQVLSLKATGIDKKHIAGIRSFSVTGTNATTGIESIRENKEQEIKNNTADKSSLLPGEDYIRAIRAIGYSHISLDQIANMKAHGVTPEYIKGFTEIGYVNLRASQIMGMKSLNITPALIKEYNDLGFSNISIGNLMGAIGAGVTPAYIRTMRAEGNDFSLGKYIQIKSVFKNK